MKNSSGGTTAARAGSAADDSRTGPQAGFVGVNSVAQKINREVALLLGWGRAILLQLAHPLVAAGVADHSSFSAAPGTRLHRLRKTLEAMIALSFGTPEEVERAAAGVNLIHDRVHGQLHDTTSRFSQGTPYSAHDPDLLAWVHITLVDSFLITYELYVGPLSAEQKDQYCAQASSIGPLLGIPEGYLPTRWTELNHCLSDRLASGEITVTDTARIVAREVISPPAPWPLKPLLWILHLPTRGLLPSSIRQGYDLHWSGWQQWLLRVSSALMRCLLRCLPATIRHWPAASKFWFFLLEKTEHLVSRGNWHP